MELSLSKKGRPILNYYQGKKLISKKLSDEEFDLIADKKGNLKNEQWVNSIIQNGFKKPNLRRKLYLKAKKTNEISNELRKKKVEELRERKKKLEEMRKVETNQDKTNKIDNEIKLINAAINEFNNNGNLNMVDSVIQTLSTNVANVNITDEMLAKLMSEGKFNIKSNLEVVEMKKQIEDLKRQIDELNKKKEEVVVEKEKEDIEDKIEDKEDEMEELIERIKVLEESSKTLSDTVENFKEGVSVSFLSIVNQMVSDKNELEEKLKTAIDDDDKEEIRKELELLNNRINESKLEIEENNKKIQEEFNSNKKEIEQGIQESKDELKKYYAMMTDANEEQKKVFELKIMQTKEEIEKWQQALKENNELKMKEFEENVKVEIEIQKSSINEFVKSNKRLQREIDIYKSNSTSNEQKKNAYKNIIDSFKKHIIEKIIPNKIILSNGTIAKNLSEIDSDLNFQELTKYDQLYLDKTELLSNKWLLRNLFNSTNLDADKLMVIVQYFDTCVMINYGNSVEFEEAKDKKSVKQDILNTLNIGDTANNATKIFYDSNNGMIEFENPEQLDDLNETKVMFIHVSKKTWIKDKEGKKAIGFKDLTNIHSTNMKSIVRNITNPVLSIIDVGLNDFAKIPIVGVDSEIDDDNVIIKPTLAETIEANFSGNNILEIFGFNVDDEINKIISDETIEIAKGFDNSAAGILSQLNEELKKYRIGFNMYVAPRNQK